MFLEGKPTAVIYTVHKSLSDLYFSPFHQPPPLSLSYLLLSFLLPFSGLIQKHYEEIINGFRDVIVDVIFDTEQLQSFFSEKDERIRKILKLGNTLVFGFIYFCTLESRVSGLLDSDAAQKVIDSKIDSILASPQGITTTIDMHVQCTHTKLQIKIKGYLPLLLLLIYKGMHLLMMNVDEENIRRMLQINIRTFIDNISPIVSHYM